MNSQREIYEALLTGETLVSAFNNIKVKLVDGALKDISGKGQDDQTFRAPDNWDIYKEPKWYENIPEGGVLCWCCKNVDSAKYLRIIIKKDNNTSFWDNNKEPWGFAIPLTKQEIQVFMDNAPEANQ